MKAIRVGDLVESTLRNSIGNFCSIKKVTATKNKVLRFEPVHALYEQRLIHHLGRFIDLETQLLSSSADISKHSPNSLDSFVYSITWLASHSSSSFSYN